jgi:hypothetical protein
MKPELLKHLTDHELLLVNLLTAEECAAWKKEFELRDELTTTDFKNYYLTREEFNKCTS